MKNTLRRDTPAEVALRALFRAGARYRVDYAPLKGVRRRADIVFTRARLAVYVDGCFWHCCPIHGSIPKKDEEWWGAKLAANVARDRDTDERLRDSGWRVVRIWEHEEPLSAADEILSLLQRNG